MIRHNTNNKLNPIQTVTLEKNDMHFESEDLEAAKAHIDEALADIAKNLIARFGGRLTERYVEE
jgi:hypothetical protein